MKKALITGISGFAGSHLAEYLISQANYEVFGNYISDISANNLSSVKNKVKLEKVDLMDYQKVSDYINSIKPDYIFHLAALTSPAESFNNPSAVMTNNITAQVNVLEAVKNNNLLNTSILVVSSAEVYGMISQEDLPINEEVRFKPVNPYAVSKVAQDLLGLQYFLSNKIKTIRVRPFNHIGPRQSPAFVASGFAKKIAEIEKNKKEPILTVGNLDAKRDFTDVRDMVKAYLGVLENGQIGDVYNIGSGKSYQISEILNILLSFSQVKIEVKQDPLLLRPSDVPDIVSDNSKIKKIMDWSPSISIDKTLKDTLDYWRNIV